VRRELIKLPGNAKPFQGLSVPQVIATTEGRDIPRLSAKTLNDHLELYGRLFSFAHKRKWVQLNPFDGVRVISTDKERAKDKRDMFTRDELAKIFSTALHSTKNNQAAYRYWTPLIALFTGARRAEIAALYIEDVRKVAGVWVFDFNENTSDKRVKNVNGLRLTPIHPFLLGLGLLEYAASLKQSGHKRLFPDLGKWTEKEGYGRAIGEWFTEHLRRIGVHARNKKVFYSFRHTLSTELRRAGADLMAIEKICGRSYEGKTVGETTYIKDDELPILYNHLSHVDFSNELVHVHKWNSPTKKMEK
jgi:integrase